MFVGGLSCVGQGSHYSSHCQEKEDLLQLSHILQPMHTQPYNGNSGTCREWNRKGCHVWLYVDSGLIGLVLTLPLLGGTEDGTASTKPTRPPVTSMC